MKFQGLQLHKSDPPNYAKALYFTHVYDYMSV